MNLKIVFLISCLLFSNHALSSGESKKTFNDQQRAALTDPQNDLNCKMYGLAGAMFAERRNTGVTLEQARKDVLENFQLADTPTELEKTTMIFVMNSLYGIGEDAYENTELLPDTILQSFPDLCLSKILHPVSTEQKRDFFAGKLACQNDNPLDFFVSRKNWEHPQVAKLQTCFRESSYKFMRDILGLNAAAPAEISN